jgi:hypothetical protein
VNQKVDKFLKTLGNLVPKYLCLVCLVACSNEQLPSELYGIWQSSIDVTLENSQLKGSGTEQFVRDEYGKLVYVLDNEFLTIHYLANSARVSSEIDLDDLVSQTEGAFSQSLKIWAVHTKDNKVILDVKEWLFDPRENVVIELDESLSSNCFFIEVELELFDDLVKEYFCEV